MLTETIQTAIETEEYIKEQTYLNETVSNQSGAKTEWETVVFKSCAFHLCDFSGASFIDVTFDTCEFIDCIFRAGYFKKVTFTNCRADNLNVRESIFKETKFNGGSYVYGNFTLTHWQDCTIHESIFKNAFFSEVKFKSTHFESADFTFADFYKTKLAGLDFTTSEIGGILLSDTHTELKGAKINAFQAVGIAKLLGVKVVE